jgi:lysophospholipase L1-like esterase
MNKKQFTNLLRSVGVQTAVGSGGNATMLADTATVIQEGGSSAAGLLAPVHRNWKRSNTVNLQTMLARGAASNARGRILCVGDSYMAGYAANNNSFVGGRAKGTPNQLAALLTARGINAKADWAVGDAAAGTVAAVTGYDPRIVFASGANLLTGFNCLGGLAWSLSAAGANLTFTPGGNFDTVDILVAANTDAGLCGTFDVFLNGSGTASSTQVTNDVKGVKKITLTVPNTTNVIKLTRKTLSNFIVGIGTRMSTAPGIEVINTGITGTTVELLSRAPTTGGDAETWNTRACSTKLLDTSAKNVTIIDGWFNDLVGNTLTVSQTQANLAALITFYKQYGDVIFLGYAPLDPGSVSLANYNTYQSAMYDTAIAADIPIIDMPALLPDYATGFANGLYGDSLHLNMAGHALVARALATAFEAVMEGVDQSVTTGGGGGGTGGSIDPATLNDMGDLSSTDVMVGARASTLMKSTMAKVADFVMGVYAGVRHVKSFASGGTDDSTQLLAAYSWLSAAPNRTLVFEAGKTYTTGSRLQLIGASNFRIIGNGATIKGANGMPTAWGSELVFIQNSVDGVVSDLKVDGNRAGRTPAEDDNHNIAIWDSCQRIRFVRVQSDNACCDGWYLASNTVTDSSTFPTDIKLYDCGANNGFRNNMSLINTLRFRDYGGVYNGANGTDPQDGVDCEPNGDAASGNLGNIEAEFRGTTCNGNLGLGFQVFLDSNTRLKFIDCSAKANPSGAFGAFGGDFEIRGFNIEDHYWDTDRGVIDIAGTTGRTIISGITSRGNTTEDLEKPLIYIDSTVVGPVIVDGVKVDGSDCPVVISYGRAVVQNIETNGQTQGYVAKFYGAAAANSVLRNVIARAGALGIYTSAPNMTIDDVKLENPTGTTNLSVIDTAAVKASVNNYEVYQSGNVPAGQVGIRFVTAPARATNILGRNSGATPWTAAQLAVFAGGFVGSLIDNIAPFAGNGVAVASLPTSGPEVFNGAVRYCTNARNSGEAASAGTGAMVVYTSGKGWRIPGVSTAVAA